MTWENRKMIAEIRRYFLISDGAVVPRPNATGHDLVGSARLSGDVIWRTGKKNFNAVSHNRARP